MPKPGERVSITTADETLVGTLMPEQDDFVVLKLDSGYNMGIAKKSVKGIKLIEKREAQKEAPSQHTHTPGLPLISILHTGGTIASKVDYETGGVISRYSPEELLAQFPELRGLVNVESRLVRNMFSEDMRFAHYNLLVKEIEKEIARGSKGVVITHGTDTLHYTAAALSFMVRNSPIPVILVGAQRSSDRPSSDAAPNLLAAVHFITKTDFAGVAVCMHENMNDNNCVILPGLQCRKMHSTRRDAFKAINSKPWATVDMAKGTVSFIRTDYPKRPAAASNAPPVKPTITFINEKLKIGMLYAHPQMYAEELKHYEGYDGLVILGLGVGNIPINVIDDETKEHAKILTALKSCVKADVAVVMSLETIFGAVEHTIYTTGRIIREAGVVGHGTRITPETAFIKLAWLLSNHKQHWKEHWYQDVCGELGSPAADGYVW
jgi:glutamyl-tRNA(Gln) amidotransferase subunit D